MAKKKLTWAEQTTEDVLRPTPKVTANGISFANGQTTSGYEPNLTATPSSGIVPPQPTIAVSPVQPVAVASPMPDTRVADVNRLRETARANGSLVGEGISGSVNGQRFSAFATRPMPNRSNREAFKAAILGTPAASQGVPPAVPAQDAPKVEPSPDVQERAMKVQQKMYQDSIAMGVKPRSQRTASTAQKVLGAVNQPLSGYQKAQQRIGVPATGFGASQPSKPMARPSSMPLMGRGITPVPNRFDDTLA